MRTNRRDKNIEVKKSVLILCEGETEEKYFKGFKHDLRLSASLSAVDIKIHHPDNYSPLGLVDAAIHQKK